MSDLIDRQAAIDEINHICPVDTEYDCTLLDRVDVRCVLSDLPSVQPERKTGHWEIYVISMLDGEDVRCPKCGQRGGAPYWKYCPNCGEKKKGVQDESD